MITLECTFSYVEAGSRESLTIPSIIVISLFGSTLSFRTSSRDSKSLGFSSVAIRIFKNIICPAPNSPRQVFLACRGYLCLLFTIAKLWNPVSSGRCKSRTSLCWNERIGRNCLPIASPRYPSSIGGWPTIVAGRIAFFLRVIAVTLSTGYWPVRE